MTIRTTCWYRASEEEEIKAALLQEAEGEPTSGLLVKDVSPGGSPPTYIKTNEWMVMAQELVDTYGAPGYQEANPALLTSVTFPFVFGIMYGDVFHGGCLLLAGLWAILNADSLRYAGENGKILYKARYFL